MIDNHNALADAKATLDVFVEQLQTHDELSTKSIQEICEFSKMNKNATMCGRIIYNDKGEYVWNFGGAKGELVKDNFQFGEWILSKDFPAFFTKDVTRIMKELGYQPYEEDDYYPVDEEDEDDRGY